MTQPITQFTKANCRFLREELDAALKDVGDRLGIKLRAGNIRFDSNTAKIAVEASVRTATGEVVSRHAAPFKQLCALYGFKPEDLGRRLVLQGREHKLTGLRPRAARMPMVITRDDGKVFHASVELVKGGFAMAN